MAIVRGSVLGNVSLGFLVEKIVAADVTFTSETVVGEAVHLADRKYLIDYDPAEYCGERKARADLIVRAFGADGAVLAESALIVNARDEETVDLVIEDRRSEFERVMAALEPLYRCAPIVEWEPAQIDYAAAKIGVERAQVALLVESHRLATGRGVATAGLYGLWRAGLPVALAGTLAQGERAWRDAIARAVGARWIPEVIGLEIDALIARLRALALEETIAPTGDPAAASIGELLGLRLPRDIVVRAMELYQRNEGSAESFWDQARAVPELAPHVGDAELVVQLGNLTDNDLPLVEKLLGVRASGELATLRELAAYDREHWQRLVGDEARASQIAERVRAEFPTATVAYRLRDEEPAVSAYLLAHPDLELATADVGAHVAAHATADAAPDLVTRLQSLQRVFKLTPHTDEIRTLRDAGFDSAHAIASRDRDAFVGEVALAADRAAAIHDRAERTTTLALMLWSRHAPELVEMTVNALPSAAPDPNVPPTLTSLFGSQDFCACEHCRSVLSPAAYFVDLLQFVERHAQPGGLKALFDRRPDLRLIELSCANTLTPLPYIDLVNEILAEAVAPRPATEPTPQTAGTAEELRAAPEHVNPRVDAILTDAVHAIGLPFDRPWTEATMLLRHLGIDRGALITVMPALAGAPETPAVASARERLGLAPSTFAVIAGSTAHAPWQLWGLAEQNNRIVDPMDRTAPPLTGTWIELLSSVPVLMHRAGVTYDELQALLATGFIDPSDRVAVTPRNANDDDCDRRNLVVTFDRVGGPAAVTAALSRLNRFVRLWRGMGWTIDELDAAIEVLGSGTLDEPCLVRLAALATLHADLGVPRHELLAWWGPIDLERPRPRSLYQTTFLDRSVINPPDPALDPAKLGTNESISGHAAAIGAALGLDNADLALLRGDDRLALDNLSQMYRVASCARALRLRVRELLALIALGGLRPFDRATPEHAVELAALADEVRGGSLSISALDYLFRHQSINESGLAVAERDAVARIDELDADLAKVIATTAAPVEASPSVLVALDGARRSAAEAAIAGRLATSFGLEPAVAAALIGRWLRSADRARSAADDLVPPSVTEERTLGDVALKARRAQRRIRILDLWPRLAKAVEVIRASGLALADLTRAVAPTGWLALDDLPLKAIVDGTIGFAAWRRTLAYARLRDTLAIRGATLGDLLDAAAAPSATIGALAEPLAAATGCAAADVVYFAGTRGFAFAPADLADAHKLARLVAALRTLDRLGVGAEAAHAWTGAITTARAAAVVAAARARHRGDDWLAVVRPFSDELRERRRNALIVYLIATVGFTDATALFDHYLIDVEMGACQRTARIAQAIGTVQLFIQRALFQREGAAVALGAGAAHEWKWMRSNQLWEANRKVFLYPENWVEAELRTEQTPAFAALQSALLQGEPTAESVEQLYRDYLAALATVASLEVRGVYHQAADDAADHDVVHVFARTRSEPRVYYYRRRVDGWKWTAWEPIDLDIEGDHLIPFVHERRLHLLWPRFREVSPTQVECQLAWSRYRDGRWSPRRLSSRTAHSTRGTESFAKHLARLTFWPRPWGDDFELDLRRIDDDRGSTGFVFARPQEQLQLRAGDQVVIGNATSVDNPNPHIQLPKHCEPAANTFKATGGNGLSLWSAPENADYSKPIHPIAMREIPTLAKVADEFTITPAAQWPDFLSNDVFFFQDVSRTYFVEPFRAPASWTSSTMAFAGPPSPPVSGPIKAMLPRPQRYRFEPCFHPWVGALQEALDRDGVDGILGAAGGPLEKQMLRDDDFARTYSPDPQAVARPYPVRDLDFSPGGAYSTYNWELFFHVPFLIAEHLRRHERFEEATRWYHYLFDPMRVSSEKAPGRYWRLRPFAEAPKTSITTLLRLLGEGDPVMLRQVEDWREYPFDPHRLAALRPITYPRTVVMRYLDNLIGWADQLFRRDSLESINEATMLYVLAAQLLGPRPITLPPHETAVATYASLAGKLDAFSNAWEAVLPALDDGRATATQAPPLPRLSTFCVPPNDKLLAYHDVVADRLFKIRHCQNFEGTERELPLYEPPIDPALLVRAAAAGLDLGEVLRDITAPRSHYRFAAMAAKAGELCAEVRGLGASLLGVLQTRDAEALARLRSGQELQLLGLIRNVRVQQVTEAERSLEAVQKAHDAARAREIFYKDRAPRTASEQAQLDKLSEANSSQQKAADGELTASFLNVLPNVTFPFPSSFTFGGSNLGAAASAYARWHAGNAADHTYQSSRAGIESGLQRREEEWSFLVNQARLDGQQIDKQIAAAEIRLAMANHELANHDQQVANARAVDEHMRTKATNQELYGWIIGQISATYLAAYQLAYDLAKRAERTYRFELGLADSSFIQPGHWDRLHQGLLAGDQLAFQLKAMEASYLDLDRREYELTKHISLATIAPDALVMLRTRGECEVDLPEALFDRDYPGHYLRRFRSVSVTLPCVTGPLASVNCTLTLLKNRVRRTTKLGTGYGDGDFADDYGATESIATSSGSADGGLFEPGARDARYLPFEGAGVVSKWGISLPRDTNAFDRNTLADVVLHVRYTARDGGDSLRDAAARALMQDRTGWRLFSARAEYPAEWHRFLHPESGAAHTLGLPLSSDRFPFPPRGRVERLIGFDVLIVLADDVTYNDGDLQGSVQPAGAGAALPSAPLQRGTLGLPHLAPVVDHALVGSAPNRDWIFRITSATNQVATAPSGTIPRLRSDALVDILIICRYRTS